MPTTITSAGITFNDATSLTSANIGTAQLVNGSVTAEKLGTNEQKQIAKAWVNFDGTTSPGTIRSSYNVSSITRLSTGFYQVNFSSAMSDVNYSLCLTSYDDSGANGYLATEGNNTNFSTTRTASSFILGTNNGTSALNSVSVNAIVFGN